MNLSKHILETRTPLTPLFINGGYIAHKSINYNPIPPIVCNDGFTVSIQAGSHNYCIPRTTNGPWTHFEMGYPSEVMDFEFLRYAEDKFNLTNTVYKYVPEELIIKLLESHGGVCINTFFQPIIE